MNKEEIKVMIKDCVYSDDGITYMSDKQYNNCINIIEQLQKENQELKKELEEKNKHQIFIDTKDIEERYGEQLYQDYLVEQNKDLKQENKELKEHIEKYEHYCKTTGIEELMQENKKYKEVIEKAINYINDNLIVSSILDGKKYYALSDYSFDYKELLDILKEVE